LINDSVDAFINRLLRNAVTDQERLEPAAVISSA
jgi:hypothetical protein